MDVALYLFAPGSLIHEQLPVILAKGTLICVLAVSLCRELSFMPAVVRHRIALGAVCCLALLPMLSWGLPTWQLPILPRDSAGSGSGQFDLMALLCAAYLMVAVFLLFRLVLDVSHIARVSRRAVATGAAQDLVPELDHRRGSVPVLISDEIASPLALGWLEPRVLIPRDALNWDCQDRLMAVQHELTHIERNDWLGHVLSRLVHAVYWPVPGIRQLMRQLSLSMEQACDDEVLASGASAPVYAALLLRQARGNQLPASVALGQGSELGIRIRYLVEEIVDHSIRPTGALLSLSGCVLLSMPLAAMQLGTQPTVPVLEWGSVKQDSVIQPLSTSESSVRLNESVIKALSPGPEQPDYPPHVERPPHFEALEKPTIPPPP